MDSVERDRVLERLVHIADVVNSVRERLPDSAAYDDFRIDPFAVDGLVYRLQTAVQSMIDVAFQLSAKEFSQAPESAMQAFEILESEGITPAPLTEIIRRMVRFRNLVVHGYLRRDDAVVKEIALQHVGDLSACITL